jgi:beta-N-acetylglucosaminidase
VNNLFKRTIFVFYIITLILTLFINIPKTMATTTKEYFVNGGPLNVRIGAGTNYDKLTASTGENISLSAGQKITFLESATTPDAAICSIWYNVSFTYNASTYQGFICGDYVTIVETINPGEGSDEYENYLSSQGFPADYWPYLKYLHSIHPSWVFNSLNTGLDWNNSVIAQSYIGKSLIQGSEVGYRSTEAGSYNWSNDTWKALDGTSWYAANKDTVAYYMDPRNFLNESSIFMFEELTYNNTFQTSSIVQKILGTSFMPSVHSDYLNTIMKAAVDYNISPVHISSRIRQEVGLGGSAASSGAAFTYNSKTYSGLYNFYNIGATSGVDAVYKGLIYANGGETGSTLSTTYLRPWNNPYTAILGGAYWISYGYISKGQSTPYLQRWNVSPTALNPIYTHQYMTNIAAPVSEGRTSFNGYNAMGLLDEPLVFTIPVYKNMPISTPLPKTGNPNNYLSSLTVNGTNIDSFSNYKNSYDFYVSTATNSVVVDAAKINSNAAVTGIGNISLTSTTTPVSINVKAQNGDIKSFTLNIIKSDQSPITIKDIINNIGVKNTGEYINGVPIGTSTAVINDNIKKVNPYAVVSIRNVNGQIKENNAVASGDTITITSNNETKSYTITIYGDNNGDGDITIMDLLRIQKTILKSMSLSPAFSAASDINKDGVVTIMDLLKVQKHILGSAKIEQ